MEWDIAGLPSKCLYWSVMCPSAGQSTCRSRAQMGTCETSAQTANKALLDSTLRRSFFLLFRNSLQMPLCPWTWGKQSTVLWGTNQANLECSGMCKVQIQLFFFAIKKEKKKYSSKLYPFILCPEKDLFIGLHIGLKPRLNWLCHSLTPLAKSLSSSLCLWDWAPFLIQCWMVWGQIRYFIKSNTMQNA